MKTQNANNALVVVVVIQLSGTEKYNIEFFREREREREAMRKYWAEPGDDSFPDFPLRANSIFVATSIKPVISQHASSQVLTSLT